MSLHYITKDFAKQFRNECGLYSPTQEYQFGNLLVKQISGGEAEAARLGDTLREKFFNDHLIYQILLTLANENLPAARKLYKNATTLKNDCETYLRQEPYTAHYYNEHIAMLHSFSKLIDGFNKDINEQVYSQLSQYYTSIQGPAECMLAESQALSEIIGLTEFYLKNILSYYNYFIVTWQYEANNNNDKGIQLATHMGDHLQALIVYTEKILTCIEETRSLLLTWEEKMEIKEEQDLFN